MKIADCEICSGFVNIVCVVYFAFITIVEAVTDDRREWIKVRQTDN